MQRAWAHNSGELTKDAHGLCRLLVAQPQEEQALIEAPMGDAQFFARTGPYALADIANAAVGTAPAINRMFAGVAPLQSAGRDEVSFLDNRRYVTALEQTMAGAVIVHPQMQARVPSSTIAIVTASTYEAWARVAALFHPVPAPRPGIHPSALVDREARVDASAEIGPYAVVEARAEIGPGCRIGSFVSIGAGVVAGRDCRIGAHASLSHALLGSRVYIYPGAKSVRRASASPRPRPAFSVSRSLVV